MKNIRRDILIGVDDNIYDRGMEALNETVHEKIHAIILRDVWKEGHFDVMSCVVNVVDRDIKAQMT